MTEREKAIRALIAERAGWVNSDAEFLLSVIDGYRKALECCAEGAFILTDREKLINIAKQALDSEPRDE